MLGTSYLDASFLLKSYLIEYDSEAVANSYAHVVRGH